MAYNGRRGPNVSQYIANLNEIPSAQDLQSQEDFNLEDDLAMFTNTTFFDFDASQSLDLQPGGYGVDGAATTVAPDNVDMKALGFTNGDFGFPDFNFTPQGQAFDSVPPPVQTSQAAFYPSSSTAGSPAAISPSVGDKRKASSTDDFEDVSRIAAEEDKRRRNTAASARFRVKKKQREQALERSAKEMSDKVQALENRINMLETENKWLKNLITEKNESKEDIAALWKKYNTENLERKGSERKDGVGTKA